MARGRSDLVKIRTSRDPITGIREDSREIRAEMARHTRQVDKVATFALRFYAPQRSGRLQESIESKLSYRTDFTQVRVYGGATDRGFAYLDVTRFGHRRSVIFPKRARALKLATTGPKQVAWARPRRPTHVFLHSVRGYKPVDDWVVAGLKAVETSIDNLERESNRRITAILRHG